MCELTGAEYKYGTSRNCQLQGLGEFGFHRYFDFEKSSHGKYKVLKIYDEHLPQEDLRHFGNARDVHTIHIKEECFGVSDDEAHRPGVYKIENEDFVYIGSTTTRLTNRFSQHYHNHDSNHDKTQNVLLNGGKFTCIQSFENGTEEYIIRECEEKYIKKYMGYGKELLNKKINITHSNKQKVKYEKIKVPVEYLEDIQKCIIDNGYIITNNVVFNKDDVDNI